MPSLKRALDLEPWEVDAIDTTTDVEVEVEVIERVVNT